jgi:CheY-like chemotaxis protein
MTSRPRILIADDHNLVAELCKRLLETEFNVVGVVGDGRALVRAAGELGPDVIVLDIAMPILNGLDAGRQVKEMLPAVKLVYLTMNPDVEVAAEAFRRGGTDWDAITTPAPPRAMTLPNSSNTSAVPSKSTLRIVSGEA